MDSYNLSLVLKQLALKWEIVVSSRLQGYKDDTFWTVLDLQKRVSNVHLLNKVARQNVLEVEGFLTHFVFSLKRWHFNLSVILQLFPRLSACQQAYDCETTSY